MEDPKVLDIPQHRGVEDTLCVPQGVLEEVHIFQSRDIFQASPDAGHILQENNVVERTARMGLKEWSLQHNHCVDSSRQAKTRLRRSTHPLGTGLDCQWG